MRIPQYERQVALNPAPSPQLGVAPSNAGAAVGGALMRGGAALAGVAGKIARDARQARIDEVENQLDGWSRDALLGENGALKTEGLDAIETRDKRLREFDDQADKFEWGLADDESRRVFRSIRLQRRSAFDQKLLEHELREGEKYKDGQKAAKIDNATQDAFDFGTNEKDRAAAFARGLQAVNELADSKGRAADDPERVAAVRAYTTQFHGNVIARYMSADVNRPDLARAYYDDHKDAISVKLRPAIEKDLHVGTVAQRREGELTRIAAEAETIDARGVRGIDLEKATKLIDALTGPDADEMKPDLRTLIRQRRADMIDSARDASVRNFEAADLAFQRGGNSWTAIPTTAWSRLDSKEQQYFKDAAERSVKGNAEPTTVDFDAWGAWLNLPPAQKKIANVKALLAGKVPSVLVLRALEEQRDIIEAEQGYKNGVPVKGPKLARQSLGTQIRKASVVAGIDPEKNAALYARFDQWVWDEVDQIQSDQDRPATRDEINSVIVRGLMKGEAESGHWYSIDPTVFRFEMSSPAYAGRTFAPESIDVPPAERTKIEAALRARNKPVTEEEVQFWYLLRSRALQ